MRLKQYKQLHPGRLQFIRVEQNIHNEHHISKLQKTCDDLNPDHVILDLKLSGQLSSDEQNTFNQLLQKIEDVFQSCSLTVNIKKKIDEDIIGSHYPRGTLAEQLLSNLLADKDHPNDVALAHDLIKEISKE